MVKTTDPIDFLREVCSLSFRSGAIPDRTSACFFATAQRNNLISITEAWLDGCLEVTVYFWKDETN